MTTADLKRVRSEARSMTLDGLREAVFAARALYANAQTQEQAQYAHDLACEYAEVYQRAAFPRNNA